MNMNCCNALFAFIALTLALALPLLGGAPVAVPEPNSLILVGGAAATLILLARKRRKK